jgi:hypothetical protein
VQHNLIASTIGDLAGPVHSTETGRRSEHTTRVRIQEQCRLIAEVAHEQDSLRDITERLQEQNVPVVRQTVHRRIGYMRDDLIERGETLALASTRRPRGSNTPSAGRIARSWAKYCL